MQAQSDGSHRHALGLQEQSEGSHVPLPLVLPVCTKLSTVVIYRYLLSHLAQTEMQARASAWPASMRHEQVVPRRIRKALGRQQP